LDVDRLTDHESFTRQPYLILREDGTLSQKVTFTGGSSFARDNFEASAYAQDRWAPYSRWLMEPGVRFDWDEVIRDVLVSPRLASTHLLSRRSDSKLTWGVGLYYDASNLDFLSRSLSGQRLDYFYDPTGQNLVRPPVQTLFLVNDRELREPRFLNWSVGLERKMPQAIFLRVQFVQKRGRNGWAYFQPGVVPPGQFTGLFELTNQRRDRYDGLELTMRRMFRGNRQIFASYTRSAARSNAVLNFSLESTLFSQQAGGPFAWDAPNRLVSWAWLPLPGHLDLGYSLEWRDGYPFFLVNQEQQMVAPPGARRFPTYFTLDLSLERRFTLFGLQWAMRGGFENLTNHFNPWSVDNNVNSSTFLAMGGSQSRALLGRIRLLGRK
jgi:outer membrane receptor for ferrienterochelin and colicin